MIVSGLAQIVLKTYALLTILLSPLAGLILEYRRRRGKEDPVRLMERLGRPATDRQKGLLVWVHAASLGEARAIMTVVETVVADHDDATVLFTSGTRSSAAYVDQAAPPRVLHQFVPLDFVPCVRRFLAHWRPDIAIIVESELWPVLLLATRRRSIPIILLNARLSGPSFRRWQSVRWLARSIMLTLTTVHAQNAAIGDQFLLLGLPPERLAITGSLKQSNPRLEYDRAAMRALEKTLGGRPVWLAASTHSGEEVIALEAHRLLCQRISDLLLVIVPRHPERAGEVMGAIQDAGFAAARRAEGILPQPDQSVYLADTFGELGLWYRLVDIAFIGGSLVPIGGHNPWEPGLLSAAILHGPHVENFAGIYRDLVEAGASMRVPDANGLAAAVETLTDTEARAAMTEAAHRVVTQPGAAVDAATDLIADLLQAARSR